MRSIRLMIIPLLSATVLLAFAGLVSRAAPSQPRVTPEADTTPTYPVVDIQFTNYWDNTQQRASLALPSPLPSSPVPVVIYAHGSINCADKNPHHAAAVDAALGQAVAARGWIFAAAELHGERPLDQAPDDIGVWCTNVSVGYRPLGARPAQRDLLYLLDYVRSHYNVDTTRVYLLAHSAGGLTALTTLAKYPDLFAAAVVYWSPTDLAVWHDERISAGDLFQAKNIRREVGGYPAQAPYDYARRSPLTFARNLTRVPLALIHGYQDTKVPFHHSQDLFNAIHAIDPNAPVVLYGFDGGHSDPNTPYTITWVMNWLASYSRGAPPNAINLVVDAGGTLGVPGEPELGPFDHFWWLGWIPRPGSRRWTRVTFTHTTPLEVAGTVSDTAGLTLTLDTEELGWPGSQAWAEIRPPAPTPVLTTTLIPVSHTLTLALPAGRVHVRVWAPTPTPTPTPTPSTGTIAGRVFHDMNENGVPDTGEPGIAAAHIRLLQGGSQLATFTTQASGWFTFTHLAPGLYIVEETNPPGYEDTTWNVQPVQVRAGDTATVFFGDRLAVRRTWLPVIEK